jgi:hypothetical protein
VPRYVSISSARNSINASDRDYPDTAKQRLNFNRPAAHGAERESGAVPRYIDLAASSMRAATTTEESS